jgi:putative transposase
MIDRTHALPVKQQCQILSLARSTAYYRAQQASEADFALMRRIDGLHMEHPFAGSRMLRDMLKREGHQIGRKHVATLMKKMGIEAMYKKPNTSRRHPAHPVYPYLLRNLEINRPNQVFAAEIVCTQMTKTDVFATRMGGDDIPDFDLRVRDDHPVDQKFNQLALLFEAGVGQTDLDAGTEIIDGHGESGDLFMMFCLSRELSRLFRQRLITLFQFSTPPLVLG